MKNKFSHFGSHKKEAKRDPGIGHGASDARRSDSEDRGPVLLGVPGNGVPPPKLQDSEIGFQTCFQCCTIIASSGFLFWKD